MISKQALLKLKNDKKYNDEVINTIEKDLAELEERRKIDEEILTMDIRNLVKAVDFTNMYEDLLVLDVIEKKCVDMKGMKECMDDGRTTPEIYNNEFTWYEEYELTQTEFNLIKRWWLRKRGKGRSR